MSIISALHRTDTSFGTRLRETIAKVDGMIEHGARPWYSDYATMDTSPRYVAEGLRTMHRGPVAAALAGDRAVLNAIQGERALHKVEAALERHQYDSLTNNYPLKVGERKVQRHLEAAKSHFEASLRYATPEHFVARAR